MRVIDDLLDLGQFTAHRDSTATICVLTRFEDPQVLAHTWVLLEIRVVHRLAIRLLKFMKSRVGQPILDVVCQRQVIKCRLARRVVVTFHVVVDSLLVR